MRYVWIALFCALVIGLAAGPRLLLREPPADEELRLISPHWDGIRHEFERAFGEYYFKQSGRRVKLVWLDMGGTGEIRKYLTARFEQARGGGIGVDILFGGGMDMLPAMADKNFFEPHPLSDALMQAIPAEVNGQLLRDNQNRYHAACLSGFGFVYNKQVVARAGLPVPRLWEDLGAPAMRGWVSCGDPGTSGSLHQAFEIVLQSQDWENGYAAIARLMSNVCAFNEGGTSVPRDVSLGQAAAGPCIDFYASAPVRRQGATHLQLVIPEGAGVATPDCIAIFRQPPNHAAAVAFLDYVLSEAGQRLWYQARGSDGGPREYDLERLPVMPAIYERAYPTNTVTNPFKNSGAFTYDSRKAGRRWTILNDLWRAVLLDVHRELWEARGAVIAAGRDADLGVALCRAPLAEKTLLDLAGQALGADAKNALRNQWSAWARTWYAEVPRAAVEGGAAPNFTPAPVR